MAGHVRHWGRDAALGRREKLYRLRRRIAYISPQQVLLHLITLAENIALGPCYYQGCSEAEALRPTPTCWITWNSRPISPRTRPRCPPPSRPGRVGPELVKGPELILAVISGDLATTAGAARLANVLRIYLARYGAAALLLGESLEAFYPLGHRLFLLETGQLRQQATLEHRARPLTGYLPLV